MLRESMEKTVVTLEAPVQIRGEIDFDEPRFTSYETLLWEVSARSGLDVQRISKTQNYCFHV